MARKRGGSDSEAPAAARPRRKPARKGRLFAETLVSVLDEGAADDVKKLRKVASALVDKAMGGDTAAIREIADRVDGKSAGAGDRERDGDGTVVVEIVRQGGGEPE
jgi:hypothetical protein